MVVVDTNVFAYALLGEPTKRLEATAVLEAADTIAAPDLLFAELANVTWQWVKHGRAKVEVGMDVLRDAEALIDIVVPSAALSLDALELATTASHSPYETIFVSLAMRKDAPLVSYDAKLLRAFPNVARSAKAFLGSL